MKALKNIIIFLCSFLISSIGLAQTTSKNYIKSIKYLEPVKENEFDTQLNAFVTYYDGLGRPIQKVAAHQSNNRNDIVQHLEYNLNNLESKQFMSISKEPGIDNSNTTLTEPKLGSDQYYIKRDSNGITKPTNDTSYKVYSGDITSGTIISYDEKIVDGTARIYKDVGLITERYYVVNTYTVINAKITNAHLKDGVIESVVSNRWIQQKVDNIFNITIYNASLRGVLLNPILGPFDKENKDGDVIYKNNSNYVLDINKALLFGKIYNIDLSSSFAQLGDEETEMISDPSQLILGFYDGFSKLPPITLPPDILERLNRNSGHFLQNAENKTIDYYKTPKYQNTTNPYSETLYEKSPLKRVLKTGAPGEDWKISGKHTVDFSYRFNTENEVKYRSVNASFNTSKGFYDYNTVSNVGNGFYPANSLYVTSVSDENGNVTEEFKDQEGKVVLKRVYNNIQGLPKLFNAGSNTPVSNPLPSVSNILGDELKGKSVQDVIDNLDKIVDNLEKNADKEINKATDTAKNLPNNTFKSSGATTGTEETLDTYYIYDQYGNLSVVTSPLLNGDVTLANVEKLGYQYKYDTKNRLVAKKLPGKSWEYMVYDKGDKLVASGPVYDPFGTETKGWIITKYDALSRVVYSGFYSATAVNETGRKTFQDNVNTSTVSFEKRAGATSVDGVSIAYTNTVFPKDGLTLLSVNYYDDYSYPGAPSTRVTTVEEQAVIQNVKGLPTGVWTRVITKASERLGDLSYILYDYNSRPLKSYTKNYLTGYTEVDTKYSFTGLPLKVTTKHQKDNSTPLVTVLEEYVYDHAERLLYQTHKVNSLAEVVVFENVYDELGALEKKRIGGKRSNTTPTASTFLQELQYKYNIRGWLTEVNNASNINQVNNGKSSLFALKLNYNKPEQGLTGIKPLYNGNISEQIWTSGIDNKKRGYGYVYDGVNRLILGSFKDPDLNTVSKANLYDEKLEYDKNGNILKLDRNGASLAGVTTAIDKLSYGYEADSNRLSTVRDASGNLEGFKQGNTTGVDYAYDDLGNLTSDKHKKITKIKYNHLNLPVEINFGTDKIEYLYTASGEKTQKKVTERGVVTLTDYLGGFQYVNSKLSFLPTAEGFFNAETNAYVYHYKDHLGNVRLSYSDKDGDNAIQSNEIIEETNYYPFGLAHTGYNQKNDALMKDYKYQYNGKEKQEELGLNFYDYGARNYDAAIGRWMNVDPLAEEFDEWTPYHYVHNNPINLVDPTGMSAQGPQDPPEGKSEVAVDGGTLNEIVINVVGKVSEFTNGASDGFKGGWNSTKNFVRSLGTEDGWLNLVRSQELMFSPATNSNGDSYLKEERKQIYNSAKETFNNLDQFTAYDWGYGVGYTSEKILEALVIKHTTAKMGSINYFGSRGGYGLFGKKGLKIGNYKMELMYSNPSAGFGSGTIFSLKQMKNGGALFRLDYGILHNTSNMGLHSTIRFYWGGVKYGNTAQRTWYPSSFQAPFFKTLK
ncbi:DUF6443 domain-containing protein [Myroides sp. N17-2]|uniref:DUF6443 domain-containing protein n=1 Tax=Myroides sp. N17-2 TaxID=2030799 RepID=UPI000EFD1492|nr:DUF6443 domain-containing protein [Myroides sp. N17-2]